LQRLFPCGKIAPPLGRQALRRRSNLMGKKLERKIVMNAAEIDLVLARMAAEIIENLSPHDDFAFIGIRRRGVHLAERIRSKVEATLKRPILSGILDINLYRDDLTTVASHPMLRETSIDFDINNLSLVLVDDVLYTGRTVRAALDGLVDLGRPKRVQLAVLIDRGHRELPIQADYVGKYVQVEEGELVEVRLNEEDGEERVILTRKP
jgi:pyrimidine operon attenuation protein/uracil phosphoribosyltransferase